MRQMKVTSRGRRDELRGLRRGSAAPFFLQELFATAPRGSSLLLERLRYRRSEVGVEVAG